MMTPCECTPGCLESDGDAGLPVAFVRGYQLNVTRAGHGRRGVPPVNVANKLLSHEVRRLRWWRTRRVGLVPIREQSRSGSCLSRLPFLREATPAVFHSPRGVKLRQVGPIAFDSVPGPFRSSPPASPGDRREAKCGGGRGVDIQVGKRGNVVASCRRRHWPRWGVARVSKERKHTTPLFGGAHFGARRDGDAPRVTTSWGTLWGGGVRAELLPVAWLPRGFGWKE